MFNHVLRIKNALPYCGQDEYPLKMAHNRKDNFKNLKTFGCRIHVCPPGVRNKRFQQETRQGIFFWICSSYGQTLCMV